MIEDICMANETKTHAIIFDLDGTLIDSGPDIAIAVNKMLVELGKHTLPVESIERFIGNGASMLITHVLEEVGAPADKASVKTCTDLYLRNYLQTPVVRTRFFKDVVDDLKQLHKAGFQLGICTNKSHALTLNILEKLGIDQLFQVVMGADIVPHHKPDAGHLLAVVNALGLRVDEVVYVGDTEVDAQCAKNAGVPFFVVSWGGGAMVKADHATRINHLRDVLKHITVQTS